MEGKPDEGGGASVRPGEAIADVDRIQTRFDLLVYALANEPMGKPRPDAHRRACIDGVRAALDCLANDQPASEAPPAEGQADHDREAGGSLPPGTILANAYQVRALIGIGGMGEVYQVRHRDLRADFAVKILKAERARDPLVVDLFVAEARALMSLSHDGIVRAHALLRHSDGRPFLVLDLARGPTLAEALLAGALEPDELRAVAFRLATSLAALHAEGLVHGDLSAENVVLVGGVEGAVLLDLGLARAAGSDEFAFAGKWSTAAPEQLDGAAVAPAVDLYALGLLLLAAATGQRLAMGVDEASARAARLAPLPLDGLPRPIGTIVRRLLDADPARRPDAREVAAHFGDPSPGWSVALPIAELQSRAMRWLRQLAAGSASSGGSVSGSSTA